MTHKLDLQPGLYFTLAPGGTSALAAATGLPAGLSRHIAYLALGMGEHPCTGEACIVLSNDRDELCTVPSRLLRTYRLIPDACCLRLTLFPPLVSDAPPLPVAERVYAEPVHA